MRHGVLGLPGGLKQGEFRVSVAAGIPVMESLRLTL